MGKITLPYAIKMCENVLESQRSFYNSTRGRGWVSRVQIVLLVLVRPDTRIYVSNKAQINDYRIHFNLISIVNSSNKSSLYNKTVFKQFLSSAFWKTFHYLILRSRNYRLFLWMYRPLNKSTDFTASIRQTILLVGFPINLLWFDLEIQQLSTVAMNESQLNKTADFTTSISQTVPLVEFSVDLRKTGRFWKKRKLITPAALHPGKPFTSSCSPTCVSSRRNEKSLMSSSVTTTT